MLPVSLFCLLIAVFALMLTPVLLDSFWIRLLAASRIPLPPQVALALWDVIKYPLFAAVWTIPSLLAIALALKARVRSGLKWGITMALVIAGLFVWMNESLGSDTARRAAALASITTLACGIGLALHRPKTAHIHFTTNVAAFGLLTMPCWILLVASIPQPPLARKIWSVSVQKGIWQAMNTSSFSATRQLVFVDDRILLVFDAGLAGYQGKEPMSNYRLVSLDLGTGAVKDEKLFTGKWGSMPHLYATNDGHAILAWRSLTSLNPDLSPSGRGFDPDHGRVIQMSPDGSTMAWETTPGTALLDSRSFAPRSHFDESVPMSVSSRAVMTTNNYWYGQYPKDSVFITLTDAHGQRLIFHGSCGGQPEFLSDATIMFAGCGKVRILDVQGNVLGESEATSPGVNFGGVSQNGKRFALEFMDEAGDPSILLYEYFIVYDSETARPTCSIHMTHMPDRQSWSAFSSDGRYFAAGNPENLSLYEIPR